MLANRSIRRNRRGAVLAASMLFFLTITVSGIALLSMSEIHRMDLVRSGLDVRLLIAAEAALETKRGQFVLVEAVQEDWSALLPTSGWNDIGGRFYVNGITVQVQGMPIGSGGHPIARLRGIAFSTNRNRAVEYTIRAASFADYALYFGENNSVNIEENTKILGPYYSKGSIGLNNGPGIEFFSHVQTSGKVIAAPDPAYNFKQGVEEYVPDILLPPTAPSMSTLRKAADNNGKHYYANTISIQLKGDKFDRRYTYRNALGAEVPAIEADVPIPHNSVIFVDSALAPLTVDSANPLIQNTKSYSVVQLWGFLQDKRVTFGCRHQIDIIDCVTYRTLLANPELRRFSMKESPEALAFTEMLGVVTETDLYFELPRDWTPLPAVQMVTDNASLSPPDTGHLARQYALDGVFMGFIKSRHGNVGSLTGDREAWITGGIINGVQNSNYLAQTFDRRNFFTDYRILSDPPPFFPKAYGGVPVPVPGTWRTYDL